MTSYRGLGSYQLKWLNLSKLRLKSALKTKTKIEAMYLLGKTQLMIDSQQLS